MKNKKVLSSIIALTSVFSAFGAWSATVNVNFNTVYQTIDGFGGMNGSGWIDDLTTAQAQTAFGTDTGQMGLSVMRMRIDPDSDQWNKQLPTAKIATSYQVKLLATPWTPPAYMKDNDSLINGGKLEAYHYWGYTDHLNNFVDYMKTNGAPLYALSLQNEPDWHPDYESCDWNGTDFLNYLQSQGERLDSAVKILAPESLNFNHALSDPLLNNSTTAKYVDIIGGHLYGTQPADYSLARNKGKQLWMTEHYTNNDDANDWSSAIGVAEELHNSMMANYSAYIWWYIRRSYGLMTDNGKVSKRGYIMSQFSKFIRPGYQRISVTEKPTSGVYVTAYKNGNGKLVIVAINTTNSDKELNFKLQNGKINSLVKYATSKELNVGYRGTYDINNNTATAWVDPSSIATFVSQ